MVVNRHRALAAVLAACLAAVLSWGRGADVAARSDQQPTFRSGVELVSVDASVVDHDGAPIAGLGAADFEVSVDGRRRGVVSAQFFDLSGSSAPRTPAAPLAWPAFTTNDVDRNQSLAPPDRLIVLAIDHSSFLPGAGRHTLEAARRFLTQLDASDRVALVAYPDPGVFVAPTTDRAAIARAMGGIAGTAERIEALHLELNLGLTEAIEITAGDRSTYEQVVARECTQTGAAEIDYCRAIIELDAPQMVAQLRARTARSLNGLSGLLENLAAINGRKTLVLVSAGLAASAERSAMDITAELRSAAEKAALADTAIHALHVDTAMLDASGADRRRVSTTTRRDGELMATGLESVVDMNGGAMFRVTTAGDAAFARITREISGYYVLGVEAALSDRDGKAHTIRVRVRGRDATVRHRQRFTIARPSATAASPDETLATVLRAGQILRDLPLRVSTQVLRDLTTENIRVLVRADIGRGVATPAHLRVGLAVFDATGQPAGSTTSLRQFAPTPGPDATWPFQEILTLRPGAYSLRVAVRDAEGRVGSVAHTFRAALDAGLGIRKSDVLLIDADRAGHPQLPTTVDGHVLGPRLNAFVEVYPERGTTVSAVSFALSADGAATPLARADGAVTERAQERRVVARADLDIRLLPPGDYTITATAYDHATPLGSASRPIVRRDPADALANRAVDAFSRGDVLPPDAVEYFLARLHADDTAGMTPAVQAAAEAAARGDFEAVLRDVPAGDPASLSVSFLRGLALFALGRIESAAVQFRAALRTSPGFMPAAFYLGGCYAAGGREEQAIDAWQMALVSGRDARVIYSALAGAWLRLGNGAQAVAVLTTARERWPADPALARQWAAARLLAKK
ncbi:MAG: VWA domain-containing protein [Vicinamibacterales bacterium]|nr:VWA domain-containing protein [Vicinamibacterales bacterium]